MDRDARDHGQVDVPTDLRNALSGDPSAFETWQTLSLRDQQAHVDSLASGSDPLARERCVRQLVNDLSVQTPGHTRR